MDWQNAVIMSRQGVAARLTDEGRIVRREADGTAAVVCGGTVRVAAAAECEGHDDWQPLDVIQATGIPARMQGRGGIALVNEIRKRFEGADHEFDEVEWRKNYISVLEHLLEFAVVYFMNLANEKIPESIRKDVAVSQARTWVQEFEGYL